MLDYLEGIQKLDKFDIGGEFCTLGYADDLNLVAANKIYKIRNTKIFIKIGKALSLKVNKDVIEYMVVTI